MFYEAARERPEVEKGRNRGLVDYSFENNGLIFLL
jgi:hypothetical protein